MASTITKTALDTEYGSFYRNGGQGQKDLKTQIYAKNGTSSIFTRRITDDTRIQLGVVTQTSVVQAWQKAFTPYGDTTFAPHWMDLFKLKVDLSYTPDDIEASWLGFLADSGLSRKDWPIIRYLIEKLILPKMQEDYELNGIYKGVYVAPTPGTPQPMSAAMDGIKQVINNGIDASTIDPIVLGAMPTNDDLAVCEYIEGFAAGIPEVVRPYLKTINMAPEIFTAYKRGKRQKYNQNYEQEADKTSLADYPNLKVAGFLSHTGSTKIWTTPEGNAIEAMKKVGNDQIFKIEEARRVVDILTDYYKGIGFEQERYVYTNDVELPA